MIDIGLYSHGMREMIKSVLTAQDLEKIRQEQPDIKIVYDPWGNLANEASEGFFITDRNPLDDGRGPFIATNIKSTPVSASELQEETQ